MRKSQRAAFTCSHGHSTAGMDQARLAEIARVSGTTVSTILGEFHEVNNEDILLLREAVRTGDFNQASFMAHRIRGAHLMLGASRVADSCCAIAVASQARDAAGLRTGLAGLEQQMAAADDGANATATAAVPAELPCAGLKFLVVEDHEFQRSLIKRLLGRLGASSIACCENGSRALEEMRAPSGSFDIMVLGLALPGVSGMDLMRMIGETRYPVSVILNSALTDAQLSSPTRWARKYGVCLLGAVSKPLTREKLEPLVWRHRRSPGAAMPAQEFQ